MDNTKTSGSRYESPEFLATYLEMEWSDWLLIPQSGLVANAPQISEKLPTVLVIPTFYPAVVQFATSHIVGPNQLPRFCDVGGATGRFLFEWLRRFPETQEAVLAEPSQLFNQWSKMLLLSSKVPEWIPVVDFEKRCSWRKPVTWPPKVSSFCNAKIFLECAFSDSVPRSKEYFNVVTCLNVADRHPKPKKLVSDLHRILASDGLLILASPMDWRESSVEEAEWFEDLKDLLDSKWEFLAGENIEYVARPTKRRRIHYISQVIAARKLS